MIELIQTYPYLFYIVVLFSSIMSSATGIGSFILIPFAAIYFGPKEGVGIITIYFLAQNINKLVFFRKFINWKIAKKVIIWSIPGVIIGSLLLTVVPVELFKKILATLIIIYILNDIFKWLRKKKGAITKEDKKTIPLFGVFYGLTSGLIGSGNLIKGPLFVSLGIVKEAYIGTYAATSLFMNIPKIAIYFSTKIINVGSLIQSIPFIFISIIGTYIGKHFLSKIHNKVFSVLLYVFFIFSAVAILLS